ncbi:hypothetical protein [Streptomyces sp. NRRL S-350]|uniref:hypothetical protein n=1 Tax=Streptomyces sp. NRRL S-350 TaxID=1463902 RepID=UPI0004BF15E6|nr:hypothetical protein [Streptomyces sp. NRRL S-350]
MNQPVPAEATAAPSRPTVTPPRMINGCEVIAVVAGASIIEHPQGFMVYRGFRIGTRRTMEGATALAEKNAPAAPTEAETPAWCQQRTHALITYHPQLDMSYCRCGERQVPGEQPMDWQAKREIFHSCPPEGPCRCYLA